LPYPNFQVIFYKIIDNNQPSRINNFGKFFSFFKIDLISTKITGRFIFGNKQKYVKKKDCDEKTRKSKIIF
jgi:hypothetical protein